MDGVDIVAGGATGAGALDIGLGTHRDYSAWMGLLLMETWIRWAGGILGTMIVLLYRNQREKVLDKLGAYYEQYR
jgi:hypothetical protein